MCAYSWVLLNSSSIQIAEWYIWNASIWVTEQSSHSSPDVSFWKTLQDAWCSCKELHLIRSLKLRYGPLEGSHKKQQDFQLLLRSKILSPSSLPLKLPLVLAPSLQFLLVFSLTYVFLIPCFCFCDLRLEGSSPFLCQAISLQPLPKTPSLTPWVKCYQSSPDLYYCYLFVVVIVVQSFGHVQLFATPRTATRQFPLSFISQSLLKLTSIESVMPSNHLVLCCPLLLLPSVLFEWPSPQDKWVLWE